MIIHASIATLRRSKWHQFAARFFFGGVITVIAGLIAEKFGPAVGGLFLAFPAVFPAAATLAQKHEEEKKQRDGHSGKRRGILVAGAQAYGSACGSIALAVFAAIFWVAVPRMNLVMLFPLALVSWLAIAVAIWLVAKRRQRFHNAHRAPEGAEVTVRSKPAAGAARPR